MDIIVASTKKFMANPKESCEINLSKNLEWSTWEGHFGNLGDTSWLGAMPAPGSVSGSTSILESIASQR